MKSNPEKEVGAWWKLTRYSNFCQVLFLAEARIPSSGPISLEMVSVPRNCLET